MVEETILSDQKIPKKILIVEDEPVLRRMIVRRAEKQHGYECFTDETGENSMSICHNFQPDIILLDMALPKISGLGLLRMMRADKATKAIPIIVYSAYGDPEVVQEALSLGANDYYTKSEPIPELFNRIESCLQYQKH